MSFGHTHAQPALSFIQPSIDITLPSLSLPQRDLVIPVLPAPTVSATGRNLYGRVLGNDTKKYPYVHAGRRAAVF
jgi:hypothetical protein